MTAVTCVPPPFTVPAWSVVPNRTVAPLTKLPPLTASVKVVPPAVALVGKSVLVVGTGLSIAKVSGADSPPLMGSGSKTVTAKLPAVAISVASITVLNCVASTNVVVLSELLTRITKPSINPEPLTVSENPAPPAIAPDGVRLITFGAATVTAGPVPLLKTPLPSRLLNDWS